MTRNLSRMLIEYHFTSQQFSRTNKIPCGTGSNCSVAFVINTHHTQLWKHAACPPHGLINKSSSKWIENSKCLKKPLKPKRLTGGLITKNLRNKKPHPPIGTESIVATHPKAWKPIGPRKRDDESLAVDEKEKANLLNCFFATFGMKLADTIKPQHQILTTSKSKPGPCIYDARVTYGEVTKKLITLKKNKATGPDGISPG